MGAIEEIRDKYAARETVADSFGRVLVARKLTASLRLMVRKMAGTSDMEVIGTMMVVASLISVDGHPIPFPKDERELAANLDMLDDPGVEALTKAFGKLFEIPETEPGGRSKKLAGDPDLKQIIALVKQGVPFEFALSLSEAERLALLVICGEVDGGKFNWNRMEWEKEDR